MEAGLTPSAATTLALTGNSLLMEVMVSPDALALHALRRLPRDGRVGCYAYYNRLKVPSDHDNHPLAER